jgi:hypothetical protein
MAAPTTLQLQGAQDIAALRLVHFSAQPMSIVGGQSTTLSWTVDTSKCQHVNLLSLYLDVTKVPASHSLVVRPAGTITYGLFARAGGQSNTLGEVTITVDDSACQPLTIVPSAITPKVTAGVTAAIDKYNHDPAHPNRDRVYILSNEASIDVPGLAMHIKLGIDVNDFTDPNVTVDALIGFQVLADGSVLPYYNNFSVSVDWPWYEKVIAGAVTGIIDHFISDEVSGTIKSNILSSLAAQFDYSSEGLVVTAIGTSQAGLVITLCPAPGASS